jgi:hypothetical protein
LGQYEHDPKVCRRATDHAWTEEKIYRAISVWSDVPSVPRRHDLKRHEAREGRVMPARPGPSPTSICREVYWTRS